MLLGRAGNGLSEGEAGRALTPGVKLRWGGVATVGRAGGAGAGRASGGLVAVCGSVTRDSHGNRSGRRVGSRREA